MTAPRVPLVVLSELILAAGDQAGMSSPHSFQVIPGLPEQIIQLSSKPLRPV